MPKVEINDTNTRHCRCPMCPVQAKSACAQKLLESEKEKAILYCARGRASCDDLDGNQTCMCPTCLVWNDYDLGSMHYCLKDSAEKIG